MVEIPNGENILRMCNRLDRIPAFDRRTDRLTDGRTSCHGIVRAMQTRRAVTIISTVEFGRKDCYVAA